jgi:triosephosphate isomerase
MGPLVGTSWKMNLTSTEATAWFGRFVPLVADLVDINLFVLPPFPAIWSAREALAGTGIAWGAQDVHPDDAGAHTGDVSAPMLADLGCRYVEIGHHERRRDRGETPALIARKVAAVVRSGMTPLLCVGEVERAPLATVVEAIRVDLAVCLGGVASSAHGGLVVAYEPAWAIGEGSAPADPGHVGEVQRAIAVFLAGTLGWRAVPVLYGGSVDIDSATRLAGEPGVDGLFVGRYALDPGRFARIVTTVLAGRMSALGPLTPLDAAEERAR